MGNNNGFFCKNLPQTGPETASEAFFISTPGLQAALQGAGAPENSNMGCKTKGGPTGAALTEKH